MPKVPSLIITIHDACPASSRRIFRFTDELENLGINYNIAVMPFFNEKEDLPRFPKFVEQIKKCKGEIALHGLYHEKANGQLDDFHTRTRAVTEVEIRAALEIFNQVGLDTNIFVPPRWKLDRTSIKVLEKLGFRLAEIQEKFILIRPRKFKKISVAKVLSWDSYGDPAKNTVNIDKNRRRFKRLIRTKEDLVRIALHPNDPAGSLEDQKEMILDLQSLGYKSLKYSQLLRMIS
jgi:predicted deacetylase